MTTDNSPDAWHPERTKPEHADVPEEEFCGHCRHHMDSHDYDTTPSNRHVPCTECPGGWCQR
jgi:hypothetical protein